MIHGRPRLTPAELRQWLVSAGLSQSDFARLLEVNDRTVRNWLSGDRQMPILMRPLLRLIGESRSRQTGG